MGTTILERYKEDGGLTDVHVGRWWEKGFRWWKGNNQSVLKMLVGIKEIVRVQ